MINLGQYLAQQLLETGEDMQLTIEEPLQESPPVDDMNDAYYDYVEQNRSKVEKAAFALNFPIEDMLFAFNGGREIVLNDDMWKDMKNTKSYRIKTLEDAISHALKMGIDPKPYIEFIKQKKPIPLPLVLQYSPTDYYLVGGEIVLSIYRSLGIIPTVLLGNITPQKQTLPEPMNESLDKKKLDESQTATLGEFIKYAIQNLGIQQPPLGLTLSYNTNDTQQRSSFGTFDTGNNKIWLYVKNRNMADILRTLAHELVHRKQAEDGRLDINSGNTGSEIENEANAQAGILLRNFGKTNKHIYEQLLKEGVYGDHLFGDKESGVKIGWYATEIEEDTPAESELFNLLKRYADSESETYSNISLDSLIPIFKKIKKQYPEIGEPKVSGYIYRGTSIPEEKAKDIIVASKTEPYNQGFIALNQTYSSRRKVSSWSTEYFPAAGFAITTAERNGGIPVIMRAKVSDAELFFNPKFMEKLSTQLEDETFNITNPIPVDIMFVQWEKYGDEFEDIESGYLSTKELNEGWNIPSISQLKQEFRVEHELKGNDFFDSEDEFLQAIENGKVITVTPSIDAQIDYRSGTTSKEELLDLIRSYRSYPKYRNEDTIQSLYNAFETNQDIDLPIIIEFTDGSKRIFSGNTRMDIAFQLGINPKALLIKSNR